MNAGPSVAAQAALAGQYPPALAAWHQRFVAPVEWRLTPLGVEARPALQPPDAAQLALLATVQQRYGALVEVMALRYQVPAELLAATIAAESSGRADAIRFEPGYLSDASTPGRLSVGLCQTLISTAQRLLPTVTVDRAWLRVPANSIAAGAACIAAQRRQTGYDPPLVAAAYNAGGVYQETAPGNPWRLRCYPAGTGQHVSRFVRLYNAAVRVWREAP